MHLCIFAGANKIKMACSRLRNKSKEVKKKKLYVMYFVVYGWFS
jgi:hypothetical protein